MSLISCTLKYARSDNEKEKSVALHLEAHALIIIVLPAPGGP